MHRGRAGDAIGDNGRRLAGQIEPEVRGSASLLFSHTLPPPPLLPRLFGFFLCPFMLRRPFALGAA